MRAFVGGKFFFHFSFLNGFNKSSLLTLVIHCTSRILVLLLTDSALNVMKVYPFVIYCRGLVFFLTKPLLYKYDQTDT